ncbi:ABC1-domain-containing protein [Backusella circina FSU 941]|nr:ABC1-domain-containing protein [Backusella circina FSU 941]
MSLARNLVDLYVITSAVTKVGTTVISSQSNALCQHLKTSSLLNPVPHIAKETEKTQHNVEISTPPVGTDYKNEKVELVMEENSTPKTAPPKHIKTIEKEDTTAKDVEQPIEVSSTIRPLATTQIVEQDDDVIAEKRKSLKESRIPTSRFSRLWNYGTLGMGMGVGAINESLKRATGLSQESSGSVLLSEANVNRLVEKLSQMRGAALKMGQMLSIQGIQAAGGEQQNVLPPQLEQILLRVHDSANYMPKKQMEKVMSSELGGDWQSYFKEFDPVPIAAASIGQVHAATLKSNNEQVVIKVQYPGVAESIDSDLSNLKTLVTFSNLLPKGLYLDNTIKVTKQELAWECDYIREAESAIRFKELLKDDDRYKVPGVVRDLCTSRVLVSERLRGRALSKAIEEPQDIRNELGERLLRLCLREIFTFKFMQTDPNWSNFFYNKTQIELLDFGACREFPDEFAIPYGHILLAAANNDREGVWKYSKELRFVTGYETGIMKDAHIDSVMTLGEPFRKTAPDIYDFEGQTVTQRVRDTIPVMLRHRLTPPPDESYGLHKKLSGAFLLCTKLGSKFDTKAVWRDEVEKHFS